MIAFQRFHPLAYAPAREVKGPTDEVLWSEVSAAMSCSFGVVAGDDATCMMGMHPLVP